MAVGEDTSIEFKDQEGNTPGLEQNDNIKLSVDVGCNRRKLPKRAFRITIVNPRLLFQKTYKSYISIYPNEWVN